LKDAVHKQFYSEDGQESASSKKRRDWILLTRLYITWK
jgi:hypothetical protein